MRYLKKLFTTGAVFLFFLFVTVNAKSQVLYFCDGVSKDGKPINELSVFTLTTDSGVVYFLVNLTEEVNTTEIHYTLYSLDDSNNENYETAIYQDVDKTWMWFWKPITFFKPGKYKIYVYTKEGNVLTSNTLKVAKN